jgi:nucleoside-diphosphate-sugar epimerase
MATLESPLSGVDCIVHFAGILFEPRPEKFLPETNIRYVRNLVDAAIDAGVGRFILISFPHVEGETYPWRQAAGGMGGSPESVHARTRLEAEKLLFAACHNSSMTPVALRPGMIYGRGVLMIEAARWAARRRLLAVWNKPTWIHLLALPDFLDCVEAAIEMKDIAGVYNLGDDKPLTLQLFLDLVTRHWGYHHPWRLPGWTFFLAARCMEAVAETLKTRTPLTRDFIRIGMASYVSDTSRMKAELLPEPAYPTIHEGMVLL